MRRLALLSTLLCLACHAARGADAVTGLQGEVAFTEVTPLAGSAELARRLVSPLNAWRLQQRAAATRTAISEQPIDLAQERFALYVPATMPAAGYALLVFVPPWNDAKVPPAWMPVLDRQGVILVTAARDGNDADVLDRRDPLALLAVHNVMARYKIDARRVYIGGFSGGARVALRVALGYPDVFRGVLLDAGSDAIGEDIPLPPRDLLQRFQEDTRVVYLTGQEDRAHQDSDRRSRQSMKAWCVWDIDTLPMPHSGHELADPAAFERALTSLATHTTADAGQLADCRSRVDHALDSALTQVQSLRQAGDTAGARRSLDAIDARYGGLAAPRSIELATQLQQP